MKEVRKYATTVTTMVMLTVLMAAMTACDNLLDLKRLHPNLQEPTPENPDAMSFTEKTSTI